MDVWSLISLTTTLSVQLCAGGLGGEGQVPSAANTLTHLGEWLSLSPNPPLSPQSTLVLQINRRLPVLTFPMLKKN